MLKKILIISCLIFSFDSYSNNYLKTITRLIKPLQTISRAKFSTINETESTKCINNPRCPRVHPSVIELHRQKILFKKRLKIAALGIVLLGSYKTIKWLNT